MGARDRVIDPLTRDYVRSVGARSMTTTIATALYHAFRGRRNDWPGDPDHGADLWQLSRDRMTSDIMARATNMIRVAAQPFLSEGLARDLRVKVEAELGGRLFLDVEITDVQAGPIDLSDVTGFGG